MSAGDKEDLGLCNTGLSWIMGISLTGLLLAAVWFRCRLLENIPGLNGDEAWYGVKAVEMIRGTWATWRTPTGNPLNPFFIGPLALMHLWFGPSIVLLRAAAVLGGLLALVLNWLLCRWVYDGRTAWISTAVLAVLPIDIVYSRFAWDASQSLAATLPVVYFSLAALRFPQWKGRLIGAAIFCQAIAVIVHPTNIFVAPVIAAGLAVLWTQGDLRLSTRGLSKHPFLAATLITLCLLIVIWIMWMAAGTPMPHRLNVRFRELINSNNMLSALILFPRLFTGGTAYGYIAGSHSWFQWPRAADSGGFAADVLVFWLLMLWAGIMLWRSWKWAGRLEDGVLIAGWALTLAAFLLFAGPGAMAPDYERFAICLIAPTVLILSRALSLACSLSARASRMILLAAALAGWFMLADFYEHYFCFIEKTGGQSHLTFRTAAEDPKYSALKYILEHRKAGKTMIIAGEWWNYWPLKYLGSAESDLRVLTSEDARKEAEEIAAAQKEGRVWHVEFYGSNALRKVEADLAQNVINRHQIKQYGGRPILVVLKPE